MAELIVLGAATSRAQLMDEASRRLDASQRKLASLRGMGEASTVAASSLSVAGAALVLVGILGSGTLPSADLAMLTVFVLASFETILPLPTAIQKGGEMAAAAKRLFEILDAVPEVAERPEVADQPAVETAAPGLAVGARGTAAAPPAAALSIRICVSATPPSCRPFSNAFPWSCPRA